MKWIWTSADFEIMGWHDCRVYAIAFSPETFEIAFDIDYIFQWVQPKENEYIFSFWVSPATLVFENVFNLDFELKSYNGGLEIDSIEREYNALHIGKNKEWTWIIKCQEGEIRFRSTGFKQYVRAKPEYGSRQSLNIETREISFYRGANETR